MPPRRSPPRHRHDGTSPLPLGMDWSPPPKRWTGRDTVWPHDPQTGWSYCVTIPSWIVQPDSGTSDDSLINPIVFYRVQVGIQSPDGTSSARGILRRFSDFLKLFSALKKSFPKKNIPPAPPKHALLRINSSRLLLEERRYALEEWMEKLLSDIDLSRSVHVASFLELEVAARSSFQDVSTKNFESNPFDSTGLSTTLRVRTGSSASVGNSVVSTGLSLASDCSSDNACEVSEAESPRHEMDHKYEIHTEGPSVMRNDIRDDLAREVSSSHPEACSSKPVVKTESSSKEAVSSVNRISDANEVQHYRLPSHIRKNSNESIASDISSVRGSELQNTGLSDSLGDSFVEFLEGESSATQEAMRDPLSVNDMRVIFPFDQRQKLNRILLTMQRRLVTAKTDMEDLIARLNQEIAVKEYLSTKVKDLEGELESSRQKSKENMQQAILVERERITQMQWDMDELRRKTLEMESRFYSEQNERMSAESEKAAAFSEREILVQDLGAKQEQVTDLQRRLEEVEMKSKSDIKVLVKEVKSLRKSQVELTEKLNKSIKEKTELERALQKEKEKREDAELAKKNLLHECRVLRGRLEDCNVNVFLEVEDSLTVNPSALPDALDLLATSDNRIGLLLAEAQLLARDNGAEVSSLGDAPSKELSRNSSATNGEDFRTSDGEVWKMLTDVFIDNAKLRKQVNSITRCALRIAAREEKEEADGSTPVRAGGAATSEMASSRQDKEKAVNVQVLLRCRPISDDELRSNAPQVLTCNELQREVAVRQTIAGKQIDRVFTFDKVFGPSAKQEDLYDQAVIPIVNEVLEGFNCTIFAYGQTGTGKTYTMEGECKRPKSTPNGRLPPNAGVIPRAVKQIFDTLESQNAEYSVKVTFLELYNEEITDLLAPEELSKVTLDEKQKKSLPLMEDGKGGVLVRGLEEEIVTSAGEIFTLLERGSAKRRTAETLLNKQSSRSHSLFSITIHIKEATPEGEELIKCGKLNLVDLAGSENISRSGAREGRAREAGEINKSLLTLGRVITALVEHLGHIPYRDSKLTRLLRDSLGGRTKTCIIATVSPSVHCLEETLSTLDYAHRAKNIKNRPEVNQKMMKSTLIKDLYGEIDRLKAEVYAAREKVGVYIPKDRYYQEETERKAMADQIEQMGVVLETNQKTIDELQEKYDAQLHQCSDLSKKLEATEKSLDYTSKLLGNTREDLKQCQYALKEKDFIISEQKKAENALVHQACVLQSDLEKLNRENASLYSKIDREDNLSAANKSVVHNFQVYLSEKTSVLCSTLFSFIARQKEQLKHVEELCQSCVEFQDKSLEELKTKVLSSRTLYISHMEAVQNIVRLHKSSMNGSLEEMSSLASTNYGSLEELLSSGEVMSDKIVKDLEESLSNQQGEVASFAQELRERFDKSIQNTKDMSEFVLGLLDRLGDEAKKLHDHANQMHEVQGKNIIDFQKAFEEQSRSETQKILAEVSTLLSTHMRRQMELVDVRLGVLRDAASENKASLDTHTASINGITNEAKRKWEELSFVAENDSREGAESSAAKHCRMEAALRQCVSTVDSASNQWKGTIRSVKSMNGTHVASMEGLVRTAIASNEQHAAEIASARKAAEEDATQDCEDIMRRLGSAVEHGRGSSSRTMAAVSAHEGLLEGLREAHAAQASEIEQEAEKALHERYKSYEPSGETPVRAEPDVPSKGKIESLRAMPMEALLEEFRENHPYEPGKEPRPSLIPRSPLVQLNSG